MLPLFFIVSTVEQLSSFIQLALSTLLSNYLFSLDLLSFSLDLLSFFTHRPWRILLLFERNTRALRRLPVVVSISIYRTRNGGNSANWLNCLRFRWVSRVVVVGFLFGSCQMASDGVYYDGVRFRTDAVPMSVLCRAWSVDQLRVRLDSNAGSPFLVCYIICVRFAPCQNSICPW